MNWTSTTSSRQGRAREGRSEGSRRQSGEPRNTNAIEGRLPRGETAQHVEALWFGGYGKGRGCAATGHVLIRGELFDTRSGVTTGAGLRPRAKALEPPPDPNVTHRAARGEVTSNVIEQKSAEAIVDDWARNGSASKGRTRGNKEEPWATRTRW